VFWQKHPEATATFLAWDGWWCRMFTRHWKFSNKGKTSSRFV